MLRIDRASASSSPAPTSRPPLLLPLIASRPLANAVTVSPQHAARNLLDELLAGEPYVITHGDYRDAYRARVAAVERAFDRMERP